MQWVDRMFKYSIRIFSSIKASLKYRVPSILVREMKKDWNERASQDAMGIIDTRQSDWNEKDFFASGKRDVEQLALPFLKEMDYDPCHKRMLEIGCGIGRMTRAFAGIFKEVYGTDVSEVMIEKGKFLNRGYDNIFWSVGNGVDLRQYPDKFFDFCFSYVVFQHIPTAQAIFNNIREMGRALKQGGLFKFQVQNDTKARRFMVIDSHKVPFIKKKIIITTQKYDTIGGAYIAERKLRRFLYQCRMDLLELTGQGTRYMWAAGRKM